MHNRSAIGLLQREGCNDEGNAGVCASPGSTGCCWRMNGTTTEDY